MTRKSHHQNISTENQLKVPEKDVLWRGGGYDYIELSKKWHGTFHMLCDLDPAMSVLEIGCGSGRMAIPFESYLTTGSYLGVDIMKDGIAWANDNYESDKLKFKHIDIYNPHYNVDGKSDIGKDFGFPFENESFDFVYLTSVFTHMNAEDTANYISEIARVLKPGAYFLASYFLLTKFSKECIKQNFSRFNFEFNSSPYTWDEYSDIPGKAVGLEASYILEHYCENQLSIEFIQGEWAYSKCMDKPNILGKRVPNARHSQDVLVGRKMAHKWT